MLKSMTGFGRAEKTVDGFNVKVNLKSVNHRYMDIAIKVPKYYTFMEEKIRQAAAKYISRGKVEVYVSLERIEGSGKTVVLDKDVAINYVNALKSLKKFGLKDDVKISTIAQYHDIFKLESDETDEEYVSNLILEVFSEAAEDFVNMRINEGKNMEQDILSHIDILAENLSKVEERYPQIVEEYRNRLMRKISEVLEDKNVDETRVITEAAVFAEKSDIGEETVRLRSHIKEFKKAIDTDLPIGKKLDFMIQEMNRETNTMGSKANDVEISRIIVNMKSEIEKIREQIQNIE
ncbi:MAG: YicC family protein [Clostridia bacterium]|nr:YicC family protein [Clostridia bacterium]